LLVTK